MSNLEIYNNNSSLQINQIQIALTSQMIKDIPNDKLFEILKTIVAKAYAVSRFTPPEGIELTWMVDETMKVLKSRHGSLRYQELEILFSRGLSKEYGDFKGLSMITFVDWAKAYMKEEIRVKLLTPKEEVKIPSVEERFTIALNLALNTFSDFKNSKSILLQGSTVYRFLNRLKIVQYNEEEQADFMNEARQQIINEKTLEKSQTSNKYVRNEINRQLDDLSSLQEKIVLRAQHNGLVVFFQECIMEETDLEALIKEKGKEFLV